MDEDALNTRCAQIPEKTRRHGADARWKRRCAMPWPTAVTGAEKLPARAVVTLGEVDLQFEVDGEIELA